MPPTVIALGQAFPAEGSTPPPPPSAPGLFGPEPYRQNPGWLRPGALGPAEPAHGESDREHICLHAATVGDGRRALLLLGDKGAGKSTLAAHMLARGFVQYSDDRTVLRRRPLEVLPTPGAIRIKPGGEDATALVFGTNALARAPRDATGVASLVPPSRCQARGPATLAGVVLVEYRTGAACALAPLPPRPSLAALLASSFSSTPARDDAVDVLLDIARRTPMHHLRHGDARTASSLLADLLARG